MKTCKKIKLGKGDEWYGVVVWGGFRIGFHTVGSIRPLFIVYLVVLIWMASMDFLRLGHDFTAFSQISSNHSWFFDFLKHFTTFSPLFKPSQGSLYISSSLTWSPDTNFRSRMIFWMKEISFDMYPSWTTYYWFWDFLVTGSWMQWLKPSMQSTILTPSMLVQSDLIYKDPLHQHRRLHHIWK